MIKRYYHPFPVSARYFDDFLTKNNWNDRQATLTKSNTFKPAVNIQEKENEYVLEIVAPGLRKEDFQIALDANILTVGIKQNETQKETANQDEGYIRREYDIQAFERKFRLANGVIDESGILAGYENGVLRITLPKLPEAAPKLIEVA